MYQKNEEVYENLLIFLSEEEAAPIASKVKHYLMYYTPECSIVNFRVCLLPSNTVDRILFFTKEDKSAYRQMKFNPDGDLISVMHAAKGKDGIASFKYGLPLKAIDKINHAK